MQIGAMAANNPRNNNETWTWFAPIFSLYIVKDELLKIDKTTKMVIAEKIFFIILFLLYKLCAIRAITAM